MNFLQLAQAAKKESGGLSGSGPAAFASATGDDSRVFDWVNWAWRDIDLMHETWAWRQASAQANAVSNMSIAPGAGPPGFGLGDFASWREPNRDYKPTAWRTSDGQATERPLFRLDYDRFHAMFLVASHQPGPLQYFAVAPNGTFMVGPTPDAAHTVRAQYIRTNTPMASDDAVPAMPERFHMAIVWHAVREYGGFDAASETWQRADRNLQSLMPQLAQACLPPLRMRAKPLA